MKFSCEKAILLTAINNVSRTVASKSPIPALEGILIRADCSLTMSAYNLETGITAVVEANVEESGSYVMPCRLFSDIVRRLPDDVVSVTIDETMKAVVRCGASQFTFLAMSADDFPELPDVEQSTAVQLPSDALKSLISGTIFSVSDNMARPIHCGCRFEIVDNTVICIAIDGYRMAMRRFTAESPFDAQTAFVVSATGLREVERILNDTDEEAVLYVGSKHISFRCGSTTVICRLLEGEFMDWRRVLPTNNPIVLVASTDDLENSLNRVSIVISETTKSPLRCVFGDRVIHLNAVSALGSANDDCDMAGDGQDLTVGFNCRYLLEAIKAIPDDETTLEMNNSLSPIVMRPSDGSDRFAYMVLPVRI